MPLKEYDVVINGHQTTLKLSDEAAKKRGLKPREKSAPKAKAKTPANKQAQPQSNKEADGDESGSAPSAGKL